MIRRAAIRWRIIKPAVGLRPRVWWVERECKNRRPVRALRVPDRTHRLRKGRKVGLSRRLPAVILVLTALVPAVLVIPASM